MKTFFLLLILTICQTNIHAQDTIRNPPMFVVVNDITPYTSLHITATYSDHTSEDLRNTMNLTEDGPLYSNAYLQTKILVYFEKKGYELISSFVGRTERLELIFKHK